MYRAYFAGLIHLNKLEKQAQQSSVQQVKYRVYE